METSPRRPKGRTWVCTRNVENQLTKVEKNSVEVARCS